MREIEEKEETESEERKLEKKYYKEEVREKGKMTDEKSTKGL